LNSLLFEVVVHQLVKNMSFNLNFRACTRVICLLSVLLGNYAQAFSPSYYNTMQAQHIMNLTSIQVSLPVTSSGTTATTPNGIICKHCSTHTRTALRSSTNSQEDDQPTNPIEEELDRMQNTLSTIEAIEERNKAQLDSFVDEEDQWDSLEEYERELLQSKEAVVQRMDTMAEELLQMWLGTKSIEG
jgi:hypothetical protein